MKNWHVHLVWALVTLVVAAAVGRAVSSNRTPRDEGPGREQVSKDREQIRELELEIRDLQKSLAKRDQKSPPVTGPSIAAPAPPALSEVREPAQSDPAPISQDPIETLLGSKDPGDRAEALLLISALPDRADKIAYLRKIFDNGDKKLQLEALALLPEIGGAEASEMALQMMLKGGPPWLRQPAAATLMEIADPSAMPTLRDAYADGDGKTRLFAARALAKLGDAGPQQEIYSQAMQDLASPDSSLREKAVKRLGQVGGPEAIVTLGQSLSDPDSQVRKAAVKALGDSGHLAAIVALEPALADSDEDIRKQAARAIELLQNPQLDGPKGSGKGKKKKK